jgi:predicted amidohydrolase YtcJ
LLRKKLQARCGILAVLAALLFGGYAPAGAAETAEYVFRNGPIYTADPATPTVEAVAVGKGRILYAGPAAGVETFVSKKTRTVDLQGKALFPGFVDGSARLLDYAEGTHQLDLSGAKSYDEIVRRVAQAVRKTPLPTSWIIGRGWNENEWTVKDPVRLVHLQPVSGLHPIVLYHATDDALVANTVVLGAAGLVDDPPDPPGGRLLRTRGGLPTGILIDQATRFVKLVLPQKSVDEIAALYREAAESCAVRGITQVHDTGLSLTGLDALEKLARSKDGLPVRVYGVLSGEEPGALERLRPAKKKTPPDNFLEVRSIGLRVDGGLDTRGAALARPYDDEPQYTGHFVYPPDSLNAAVDRIVSAGYQPVLRATGDAAVRAALDALQAAGDPAAPEAALPPRIESAAVIGPEDIARMKALGVVASMQPQRVSADYPWIEDRLGIERDVKLHAWQTLTTAGVPVMLSSGAPAAVLDPVQVFYSAITRQNKAGRPASGWTPEERLTRDQALEAMTRIPALSVDPDGSSGTIAAGKRADLTVLSRDIMQVPERDILSARVTLTRGGGRIVHEKS